MLLAENLKESIYLAAIMGKISKQDADNESCPNIASMLDDESFDIPENWIWVRLIDILDNKPTNGNSPKGVAYVTPVKNLTLTATTSGYFKKDAYKYVDIDLDADSPYWLKHNDLLIQRSNSQELVGTSCIYTGKDKEFMYPDLMMRMRINEAAIVEYVDIVLKSPFIRSYYKNNATGTSKSMPKINQQVVCNTPIPLPPKEEQHRIVTKVDELMAKIDDLGKTESELEAIKKAFPGDMKVSLLQAAMQGKITEQLSSDGDAVELIKTIKDAKEMLIKDKKIKKEKMTEPITEDEIPFDIPDNWRWLRISDCCNMYTGNSISEAEKQKKYTGLKDGYNYIGTKDVGFDHSVLYENGVKISFEESKFKYAFPNATLMCIEGGSAGRKIAMINEKVCFGNKLCAFHSISILPEFLYYYLQAPVFTRVFAESITGIIGGVSINKLKTMLIPLPPLAEQQRIVLKLDKLLPLCEDLIVD